MEERINDEVIYYYDLHPTEEDLMGETSDHSMLVRYLMEVLTYFFEGQTCAVYENLNFYQTDYYKEEPLAPDIAVIKGVVLGPLTSWRVQTTGPAPHVVLEILSAETWKKDLEEKPDIYARLGVQEYFAYDPNPSPLAPATGKRLFGWRRDALSGGMTPLLPNEDGSLWSEELDSFLVPNERLLRLADRHRQLRLTQAEALAEKLRSLGVDPDQL